MASQRRISRQPIHSGSQVLKFVTDRKPAFAGVDAATEADVAALDRAATTLD